ncbi:MAG: hypothetical protein Q8P20_10305 [bacterium]|nr:hypothetical protein [bacterium]
MPETLNQNPEVGKGIENNKYDSRIYKWVVVIPLISYLLYIILDLLITEYNYVVDGIALFSILTVPITFLASLVFIILSTKKNKFFYIATLILSILVSIHFTMQIRVG